MLERITIYEYRYKHPEFRLTNQTDGGEGVSGWVAPQEYREHMRLRNVGERNPNYHNWWSDEQKKAASARVKNSGMYRGDKNPRAKRVMCVENGEIYNYISDALSAYSIKDHSNMSAALRDRTRTAGGVHWVADGFDDLDTPEKRAEYLNQHKRRFCAAPCRVRCIETGEVFPSIKQLKRQEGITEHQTNITLTKRLPLHHNNKTYVVMQ